MPIALVLAALSLLGMPAGSPAAAQDAGRPALCAPAPCVARTIPVGHSPTALAVDTRTQHAFVRTGDGTISVLDLTNDTLVRTVVVSKPDVYHSDNAASIAVDERTGRVFASMGNAIHVLDATNGMLLGSVARGSAPGALAVDEHANRVFVLTGFNDMSLLEAHAGRLLHTVHLGGNPGGLAVDQRTDRVFVAATGFVKVLDATNGTLLRTISGVAPGNAYIAVDEATGRVFLAAASGGVFIPSPYGGGAVVKGVSVLDARDGTLLRSAGAREGYKNSSVGALVVDERAERVFVVGNNVSVLDARSGAVLITRHLPRTGPGGVAGRSDVDEQSGRLVVPIAYTANVTGPPTGTVSVVDTTTARVLTTIAVDVEPVSAVVNARARQVLVLNHGATFRNPNGTGRVSVLRLR